MQAHKRIQISVPVLPSERFNILNNVAEVTEQMIIIETKREKHPSLFSLTACIPERVPPGLGGRGGGHWLRPGPGQGGEGVPGHPLRGGGRCYGGMMQIVKTTT